MIPRTTRPHLHLWLPGLVGALLLAGGPALLAPGGSARAEPAIPSRLDAKSELIRSIDVIQQLGVRPRFSPDDQRIVFDRRNSDGFYDVYTCDINGSNLRSITEGKAITQRNNGNARFDPSGRYIVFVSESPDHFGMKSPKTGDPGVGLYSNFWATDLEGERFWQLTDVPIKKSIFDLKPSYATVNPVFAPDGTFVWTQRYGKGGDNQWGAWRIMAADFVTGSDGPRLENERVLLEPRNGNYITAMDFLDDNRLIVAGNLDGQHEYGMDQYIADLRTGELTNLTQTDEVWEEDSSISPDGRIVYMTNIASSYQFDFTSRDWSEQAVERDYFIMSADGDNKQRLTYFNERGAPEYLGNRVLVAASEFSKDGRYLAGTIGVDQGTGPRRENVELKVVMIEFEQPLAPTPLPQRSRKARRSR